MYLSPHTLGMYLSPHTLCMYLSPHMLGMYISPHTLGMYLSPHTLGMYMYLSPYTLDMYLFPYTLYVLYVNSCIAQTVIHNNYVLYCLSLLLCVICIHTQILVLQLSVHECRYSRFQASPLPRNSNILFVSSNFHYCCVLFYELVPNLPCPQTQNVFHLTVIVNSLVLVSCHLTFYVDKLW